jgi:hypothetical protein
MRWRPERKYEWHRWFAWYPIEVGEEFGPVKREKVWLEWVERKREPGQGAWPNLGEWHYRTAIDGEER